MDPPRSGYDEQQYGGIQVLSGDGLMLNPPAAGLEVVEHASNKEKQPRPAAVNGAPIVEDSVLEETDSVKKKPRVTRKCLWVLFAVLLFLVIAAAVGGGVGGALSANHKSSPIISGSPPPSTTSSGSPSHPSASSPSGIALWGQDEATNIGCYIDDTNRMLKGPHYTNAESITPQLCAGLCSTYAYFGLEDGSQCFCGDTLTPGYKQTSASDCNASCGGNPNELCGNVWRIDVYALTTSTSPVRNSSPLGCYSDGTPHILDGPEYYNQWMTPRLCAGLCNGYTTFGVEYGDQCFCGNGYNSTYTLEANADSACDYDCAGDSGETCGGFWAMYLYEFE